GNVALIGVTILTAHDTAEVERVLGRGVPDLGFEAERLARLAVEARLRGVVASGRELALLRAALGPDLWIVVPGIRGPGDSTADQRRTVTPADAVRPGGPAAAPAPAASGGAGGRGSTLRGGGDERRAARDDFSAVFESRGRSGC